MSRSAHKASFAPISKANVKGDVRGYDAHSGNLLWTFETIPSKGEYGYDTWLNGSADPFNQVSYPYSPLLGMVSKVQSKFPLWASYPRTSPLTFALDMGAKLAL